MNEITSRTNETVKDVCALCADASLRRARGLCVVHGVKLCGEAARRTGLAALYATPAALERYGAEIGAMCPPQAVTVVSAPVAEKMSGQPAPQGVVGVARLPAPVPPERLGDRRRALVLCALQDPANVGAAVRTAAAFGYTAVELSDDCADLFSPKALRASMGAAFAVDTFSFGDGPALARTLEAGGFLCVATALTDAARPVTDIPMDGRLALFIGNEGHGLPRGVIDACGACAVIPIGDRVESLNASAAAAVCMWVLRDGR
ncbi:MAG: RNA methyltransferase [Oscillospiraceae bacterium]|nr:RNA methyltransferase [Oscillospiraceae bacterium]